MKFLNRSGKARRGLYSITALTALLFSFAFVAVACPSGSSSTEPLKIGYLADYSGGLAEFGIEIENGIKLAVDQINAAGGVNGQDVDYVTGDTADRIPVWRPIEARRLIDVEGVHAIVGPLG